MRQIDASIAEKATSFQKQAAHPARSIWVSANAGTGKTTVLVERLLRLMIAAPAAAPSEILGLTFSRTGAAQMLEKLTEKLAKLAALEDADLSQSLAEILGYSPDNDEILRARALYQTVLDEPPALMTIHSFCAQVLGRFPLEAGIPPQFTLWEEQETAKGLAQAFHQTLVDLASPDHQKHMFYQHVVTYFAEERLLEVFRGILQARARLQRVLDRHGGVEAYGRFLADQLGVPFSLLEAPLVAPVDAYFPDVRTQTLLTEMIPVLQQGGVNAQKRATALQTWLALEVDDQKTQIDMYLSVYFTQNGPPAKNLVDKKVRQADPDVEAFLLQEQERLVGVKQTWAAQQSLAHTMALLHVADAFLDTYTALKQRAGALDFEDLIHHTRHLLTQSDVQDWIQYRLDRSLKHVLLDEGQDTNFRQWEILAALVQEFFAGEAQHDAPRTLFAVGDMKQSIFRFQEAQPEVFLNILDQLRLWDDGRDLVAPVPLQTSFRSHAPILALVDQIFQGEKATSLTGTDTPVVHVSAYPDAPGRVVVWPPCQEQDAAVTPEPWTLPVYEGTRQTGRVTLAQKVADEAFRLANSGEVLACTGRYINYGDMMVLVRHRTMLPALIAACHQKGVPVLVNEGDGNGDHPLVGDLLALCRLLVNPADPLALLHVFKSPFFNGTDADVECLLCAREGKEPLWAAFERVFSVQAAAVSRWQERARSASVYEVLVSVLDETHARGAFVDRFSGSSGSVSARQAVLGVLDAFLDAALAHGTGGWHTFIQQVTEVGIPLTRVGEGQQDAVRILTVHASKGMEAPIVFLPDTTQKYTAHLSKEKWLWEDPDRVLYALSGQDIPPEQNRLKEAERARMVQDERRLLYVALTRAEERLYIGGALSKRARDIPDLTWYADVHAVISEETGWVPQPDGGWMLSQAGAPMEGVQVPVSDSVDVPLPAWALTPVVGGRPVSLPDAVSEDDGRDDLRARGEALHRLLEYLPAFPASSWMSSLPHLLPEWSADEQAHALAWAQGVMTTYPWLFSLESRAEVSFYDRAGEGRIDRLVVTDRDVFVVDFKTVQHLPEAVPSDYVAQVSRYAAAMRYLYPDHTVKAAILWLVYPALGHRLDFVDLKA